MSTESMSQFLEGLHASRLLETDRIEELLRRPEPPQGDMEGTARFLESSGWLTRFQIDEIRQGRSQDLMFGAYRLLDKLPDHPGGRLYKAYHPALQQAVVVRVVDANWLQPADDARSYIERARVASVVSHPQLVNVLDAGFVGETPFLVYEYVDGADLGSLVNDMGALPVQLACDYARQAAVGLQAAHERGVFHGDLSPSRLLLTPVVRRIGSNGTGQTVSMRPAAGASIKVEGIGLVPRRPPAGQVSMIEAHLLGAAHFLPPERLTSDVADMRGDLYALGATLHFLLTARAPFPAATPYEALQKIQQGAPLRLDAMRRDVGAPLADLVQRLLSKDPAARPSSAASVVQYLQPFSQPSAPPKPIDAPYAVPVASETDTRPNSLPHVMAAETRLPHAETYAEPLVESLPAGTRDSQVYTPVIPHSHALDDHHHDMFASGHHERSSEPTQSRPRDRDREPKKKSGGWHWLIIGLFLHFGALAALILFFMKIGPFAESPATEEEKQKTTKPLVKPKK